MRLYPAEPRGSQVVNLLVIVGTTYGKILIDKKEARGLASEQMY